MTKGKIRIFLALFVSSVFLFQSCMTIMRGSSQKTPVTSNPIGAKIIVDGKEMGNAPLNLKLKRKKEHFIRIEKQGYNPLEIGITHKTSALGASILTNALWGYLIGAVGPVLGIVVRSDGPASPLYFLVPTIVGWIGAVLLDTQSGATRTLSPKELNVTLTKIGEKPHLNCILIDADKFQDIKWIRIKCADIDKEDIINLD